MGYPLKLVEVRFKTKKRKYIFGLCIVNLWNASPHEVLEADSIAMFKKRLDKFMKDRSINNY